MNDNASGRTPLSIRGLFTINGAKDPLIIFDNFPFTGDINLLNPADVQSITVLRDASAASICDAGAGNGVIVITRRAKFSKRLSLSFSSNVMIRDKPALFKLPQIAPADYIDWSSSNLPQDFIRRRKTTLHALPYPLL